ncbi:hypothetical protein ACGF5O_46080 [Streptomyces sp. NPDC048291]|uniref:hypothetical protein n=1 Tax=Streptomyces sp. NPDC048291 TaxID=3365530 RepID=UPI0037246085
MVFANICRVKTGELQVVAADAVTKAPPSSVPAVASTTVTAALRLAWFIRSSGRIRTTGAVVPDVDS